ncbi:hypothetical protein KCTC52924_02384 [Arenibacter antarcticus]|uniref:Uncharacterized protein n=1 Tax=Arenibacter antarcticus TaxID=2040469 RepID=A0ABW5VIJ0_9FLAO|nr:hypothetical protein [Arenibacter sp. H213]MCM4168692.1 hypothetical protein [Arenibacter sp. H213]
MENQNCRIGSVTQMDTGTQAINLLEQQYKNFMEKASTIKYTDSKLAEFFESKATKINKILKDLTD